MRSKQWLIVWWPELTFFIGLFVLYSFWVLPLIWHGPYNADEGWYLYDSYITWQGHMPYRDFAFPQPPLILLFHGFWQHFFGPSFYLGRIVNALLGFGVVVVSSLLARHISGRKAALLVGIFLVFSPWFDLHMVSVSTYALAALGLICMAYCSYARLWLWAGFFAVICVWTRLPLLFFLPAVLLLPLTVEKGMKKLPILKKICAGIGLAIAACVLPFFVLAGRKTLLDVVGFHVYTRKSIFFNAQDTHPFLAWLKDVFFYLQHEYLPIYGIYLLLAVAALLLLWSERKKVDSQFARTSYIFFVGCFLTTIAQLPAQNVTYDVPLIPMLVTMSVSVLVAQVTRLNYGPRKQLISMLTVIIIASSALYALQKNPYYGVNENEESHGHIARVAQYVRAHSEENDLIFTPELYIALQADRLTLPGTELGRFFYFPEFSLSEALDRHVLNQELLTADIASRKAKFVIINQAHFINQGSRTSEDRIFFYEALRQANYQLVPALHIYQPNIESFRVYERI